MTNHKKLYTFTNIIIAFTIMMYVIQISIPNGGLYLGLNIYFFTLGFYYQILSTIFAHGGIEHLAMNMLVLWQIGNLLEENIGKIRFLILYFIGGLLTSIGTLAYMYYFSDFANVVGASGAISVLFGYIALKIKEQRVGMVVYILLISFVPLLFGMNIAWYSHLIGFAIGVILGFII
jgi:membrane associated rhomboid family serine protease